MRQTAYAPICCTRRSLRVGREVKGARDHAITRASNPPLTRSRGVLARAADFFLPCLLLAFSSGLNLSLVYSEQAKNFARRHQVARG
jgi:hypothetical protein